MFMELKNKIKFRWELYRSTDCQMAAHQDDMVGITLRRLLILKKTFLYTSEVCTVYLIISVVFILLISCLGGLSS